MPLLSKYRNQPIIILDPEAKPPTWPFSFGVAKARVIIDRIFDIEKWYENLPEDNAVYVKPLDITPEINQGKRFIIDKYKAKLILQNKQFIADFIGSSEIGHTQKYEQERINQINSRRFIGSGRIEAGKRKF